MRNSLSGISGWRCGVYGIITLFTALLIIRWNNLPVFIDIYYHAGCMAGFRDAGGIVLHDFWEYAPVGRPHLYPPLFHLILLALSKTGLSTLFIIRLVSAAVFPLFLITLSWVVRKLYNDRRAFFTVLAAALPYTFFLNTIAAIPAAIAIILLILLFYAIETRRVFCAILLQGLSFYAHGAIPWIIVLTLILYSALQRVNFGKAFAVISGGIILGLPALVYIAHNTNYFSAVASYINNYFEANIIIYIFAAVGMAIALRKKGRELFYPAMLLAMLPMLKGYAFRFFCGEGLLPLVFLAGAGLDEVYAAAILFLKPRTRPIIYMVLLPWVIFYLAIFYSPVVCRSADKISLAAQGSSFLRFINYDREKATAMESSIYMKSGMDELFTIIRENTRADEIIYCNYNYVAGIFHAFTGRATSTGMLNEVAPVYSSDPAIQSALVVWIKNPEGVFDPELKGLIQRLGLIKVAETGLAYVYRNPVVMAHKRIAKAAVPANMAFLILAAWLTAILVCIIRRH
jgi:hypothetical protein